MIMDAPCHGRQYSTLGPGGPIGLLGSNGDDYPNGSPEGIVLEDLLKEFCRKEIEFRVVKLANNCDKMIEIMKTCH